jgi:hypothetical protein
MKYNKIYLQNLVLNSNCVWDVVELAGIKKQEGNYTYLSNLIKKYNIDTTHFIDQRGGDKKEKTLQHYLVKGKHLTINGNRFKEKLYKAGLKERKCEMCGQGEIWMGKKISLILDHIDGDRQNNLLDNLRIVCPNCNASLPTHCGRNIKSKPTPPPPPDFKNDEKINLWKENIEQHNIDFSKKTWGKQLSKIMGFSPQYCLKFVKENLKGYIAG